MHPSSLSHSFLSLCTDVKEIELIVKQPEEDGEMNGPGGDGDNRDTIIKETKTIKTGKNMME